MEFARIFRFQSKFLTSDLVVKNNSKLMISLALFLAQSKGQLEDKHLNVIIFETIVYSAFSLKRKSEIIL